MLDLSTRGLRMAGATGWTKGQHLDLDITFDALPAMHFAASGRVVRSSDAGSILALELDAPSRELELYIVEEIIAAVARDAEPHVILVDAKSPARSAIASAFRARGLIVTEVSTPLEAIRKLIDERFDPNVIAIADSVPESVAEELREFLASEYPEAHMIAIESATGDLGGRVGELVASHAEQSRPFAAIPRSSEDHEVAEESIDEESVTRGSD